MGSEEAVTPALPGVEGMCDHRKRPETEYPSKRAEDTGAPAKSGTAASETQVGDHGWNGGKLGPGQWVGVKVEELAGEARGCLRLLTGT